MPKHHKHQEEATKAAPIIRRAGRKETSVYLEESNLLSKMTSNYHGSLAPADPGSGPLLYNFISQTESHQQALGLEAGIAFTKTLPDRKTIFKVGGVVKDITVISQDPKPSVEQFYQDPNPPHATTSQTATLDHARAPGQIANSKFLAATASYEVDGRREGHLPAMMASARLAAGVLLTHIETTNVKQIAADPNSVIDPAHVPNASDELNIAVAPGFTIGLNETKHMPGVKIAGDATLSNHHMNTALGASAYKTFVLGRKGATFGIEAGVTEMNSAINHFNVSSSNSLQSLNHGLNPSLKLKLNIPLKGHQ